MKKIVKLKWKDGPTVEVVTPTGKHSKNYESLDMRMWRFKVLGELPKGKRIKKAIETN